MRVGWECEISLGHKEKDDVLDGFVAQTMIICLKEATNRKEILLTSRRFTLSIAANT